MATKNDELILGLKKQIDDKKKELKGTEKFNPATNCSLPMNGTRYNLNVIGKEETVTLAAFLQSFKDGAAKVFPGEPLIIGGYDVDSWISDLKSRYNIINRRTEEARLKKLEDKLHELLSTDKKVELELEELKNSI